jgi:hypothetical protein
MPMSGFFELFVPLGVDLLVALSRASSCSILRSPGSGLRERDERSKAVGPFSKNVFCHWWKSAGWILGSSQMAEIGRPSTRWSLSSLTFSSAEK